MASPQIYGLIGYPVKHSLSPAMHNAAFGELGINAEYRLFPLEEEGLKGFLENAGKSGISGLNVTIPYKEKVILFLDKISNEAGLIGAVNTVKITGRGLEGFNTDGAGFLKHLKEDLKFHPAGKKTALIGAGGAAKAISVYLSKGGAESISIYDIDKNRSEGLVEDLKIHFDNIEFYSANSIEDLKINECALLVNATPVGMKETDPSPVDKAYLREGLLVYDLIYNPKETKLLKEAKTAGAQISNGLGMLLYQGVDAFEIWTAREAPVEVMRKALKEATEK